MNIKKLSEQIKEAMRIRHSALDNDIQRKVRAAVKDMEMRGIVIPEKNDDLVDTACELYCKGQYDHLGEASWKKKRRRRRRCSVLSSRQSAKNFMKQKKVDIRLTLFLLWIVMILRPQQGK